MINDSKMKPHVQFAKALEALSITIAPATVSCITATSLTPAAIAIATNEQFSLDVDTIWIFAGDSAQCRQSRQQKLSRHRH
jgi:hypothetical protein